MKYTQAFEQNALEKEIYKEATSILKHNNIEPLYVVGGFVFKHIIEAFYGTKAQFKDLDFIIPTNVGPINLPTRWKEQRTRFNSPRLSGPQYSIDLIPLDEVKETRARKMQPSINYYLATTPLTIQSIAYDLANKQIIGELGKQAIDKKVIAINSREHAFTGLWFQKQRLHHYMSQKAKQTGFKIIPFH